MALVAVEPAVLLKGNHEDIFLNFLETPYILKDWINWGGAETLLSYGIKPPYQPSDVDCEQLAASLKSALPEEHLRLLKDLVLLHQERDYLFVHAGLKPSVALDAQRDDDLLWIRDEFLLHEKTFSKFVIHGHTPVEAPDIRSNRINIDTGAYATGRLTCLVLEKTQKRFL